MGEAVKRERESRTVKRVVHIVDELEAEVNLSRSEVRVSQREESMRRATRRLDCPEPKTRRHSHSLEEVDGRGWGDLRGRKLVLGRLLDIEVLGEC